MEMAEHLGLAFPFFAVPLDNIELLDVGQAFSSLLFAQASCAPGIAVMVTVWGNGV